MSTPEERARERQDAWDRMQAKVREDFDRMDLTPLEREFAQDCGNALVRYMKTAIDDFRHEKNKPVRFVAAAAAALLALHSLNELAEVMDKQFPLYNSGSRPDES